MRIRPFAAADRNDVRDVCIRTGAAGSDATGSYSNDDLLPDIFALPYLEFSPDLAFVVEHDGRVSGYILGVADTREFVAWFRAEWMPRLAQKYADVDPPMSREERMIRIGFSPERMLIPEVDTYPAHLHIDLLPVLQGQGLGRALIDRLCAELAERGTRGVHLTMDGTNTGAHAFYDRLGFVALPSSAAQSPVLGMRLV